MGKESKAKGRCKRGSGIKGRVMFLADPAR